MALLEKSYQLAAKYMPQGQPQGLPMGGVQQPTVEGKAPETVKNGKALINPRGAGYDFGCNHPFTADE